MRSAKGASKAELQSEFFTVQDVIGHTDHGMLLGAVLLVLAKATSLATTTVLVYDPV